MIDNVSSVTCTGRNFQIISISDFQIFENLYSCISIILKLFYRVSNKYGTLMNWLKNYFNNNNNNNNNNNINNNNNNFIYKIGMIVG